MTTFFFLSRVLSYREEKKKTRCDPFSSDLSCSGNCIIKWFSIVFLLLLLLLRTMRRFSGGRVLLNNNNKESPDRWQLPVAVVVERLETGFARRKSVVARSGLF